MDEERAVLPPERPRPLVYTYFDTSRRQKDGEKKNEKVRKAEQELLQVWRRAWWAQGFKPVVLGNPEAMNNPLYRRVQELELKEELETEVMRWLAWGNMGTGILSSWLTVPMAPRDDALLSFLRRGEYPALTRYKDLENGLFVGSKEDVDKAIKAALQSTNLDTAHSITDAVPRDTFRVDSEHDGVASYSISTVKSKYSVIKNKLETDTTVGDGLSSLAILINSHLHTTWANTFPKGIAVTKPLAQNTTAMVEPAIELARNLSQCSQSPMPASCPPNKPGCQTCISRQPMRILTPPVYRNVSTLFTIATIPHPYTLQSLIHTRDSIDAKFVRRSTGRDDFIMAATRELMGTGISSFARLARFKDAVAGEHGSAHSLWLTAENPYRVESPKDLEDLDWTFGFQLPRDKKWDGKSETPVPGPERRPPPPKQEFDGPVPTDEQLKKQRDLLEKARMAIRRGEKGGSVSGLAKGRGQDVFVKAREVMEAWNLADTEAWKFVRAWNARRRMERRRFDDEEEDFQGRGTVFNRWMDGE